MKAKYHLSLVKISHTDGKLTKDVSNDRDKETRRVITNSIAQSVIEKSLNKTKAFEGPFSSSGVLIQFPKSLEGQHFFIASAIDEQSCGKIKAEIIPIVHKKYNAKRDENFFLDKPVQPINASSSKEMYHVTADPEKFGLDLEEMRTFLTWIEKTVKKELGIVPHPYFSETVHISNKFLENRMSQMEDEIRETAEKLKKIGSRNFEVSKEDPLLIQLNSWIGIPLVRVKA